ncbi:MAG: GNAT family N-acetyltransferase [Alphaproteobacteria bacterium]
MTPLRPSPDSSPESTPSRPLFEVVRASLADCEDPSVRRDWESLVSTERTLYAQYQSPAWFDHLRATGDPGLLPPLLVRDRDGRLAGIAPLAYGEREIVFTTRERVLWRSPLKVVSVQGGEPPIPEDGGLVDRLLAAALESAPGADGVYLHSVRADGFLGCRIEAARGRIGDLVAYAPGGSRPFHWLELPGSFREWLGKFGAKKRYNLQRQHRLLAEHAHGDLVLRRIEEPRDVAGFAGDTATVVEKSWQGELATSGVTRAARDPRVLDDLARRGLLRSYLLVAQGSPCAFVVGYQYGDVYHYAEIGYDRALARFSPGTVLLTLLLEDLWQHRTPRLVNFGIGEAGYKREFGNRESRDASVFLLRDTPANRARVVAHRAFRACVDLAKRVRAARGGAVPPVGAEDERVDGDARR